MLLSKEEVKEFVTEMIGEVPVSVCPYLMVEVEINTDGLPESFMLCGRENLIKTIKNKDCRIMAFLSRCERNCYETKESEE